MEDVSRHAVCINCAKSEAVVPILTLRFQGEGVNLCSSCLPILLHRPEKLAGRLKGVEVSQPVSHGHD
jgi:hypothetical protein